MKNRIRLILRRLPFVPAQLISAYPFQLLCRRKECSLSCLTRRSQFRLWNDKIFVERHPKKDLSNAVLRIKFPWGSNVSLGWLYKSVQNDLSHGYCKSEIYGTSLQSWAKNDGGLERIRKAPMVGYVFLPVRIQR